mmetsp:Transcript_83468/g.241549  ORF Transcript_83468/g.241549 Transcript_83468/m.241549 type:complete len:326 (-) Transcript_83468:154-1131(-)
MESLSTHKIKGLWPDSSHMRSLLARTSSSRALRSSMCCSNCCSLDSKPSVPLPLSVDASSSMGVGCAISGMLPHLMRAVKVVPSPNFDFACTSPPWSFAMPCATERPKPTPWKFRESLASSCSKGSKILFSDLLAMPVPVSVTLSSMKPCSESWVASMVIQPLAVNLHAFVVRLYNIWVSFAESPCTTGKLLFRMPLINLTLGFRRGFPALSTAALVMVVTSRMICNMFTGCCGNAGSSPLCFCMPRLNWEEFSIILFTKSKRRSAQPWIMLSCFFCILSAVVSAIAEESPKIPCSGLRSSWATMDSKRDWRSSSAFCATWSVKS